MKRLLTFLLVLCQAQLGAVAQTLPPDLVADETFPRPPDASAYFMGQGSNLAAEMTPAGYAVRFVGPGEGITANVPLAPPGPALNQDGDFVVEAELRGTGVVGLYWGGRTTATTTDFTVVQLHLVEASPSVSVLRLQANTWTALGRAPLPAAVPTADWHRVRIVRMGPTVAYWVDGSRLLEQPWAAPPGRTLGLTVYNSGAALTLRRLRAWHHHGLRLAPGVPASLRRERLAAPGLNTEREEATPMVSADGRFLYFSRVMGDPNAKDDPAAYDSDVFVAERNAAGEWGAARPLGPPVNLPASSNYPLAVTPDGQTLLVAGRYTPTGALVGQGLSRTQRRADGTWTVPEALPENVGARPDFAARNSSYCLDASGTVLLRSAALPADLNNTDLYLSRRQPDGTWTPLVALPALVNTPYDETSPFLAPDGKTLYFSSNGHPGYGGNDVFVSTRLDDTWTRWSPPLNLGPAVNTAAGDGDFTTSAAGDFAYLTSYAGPERHADIYRLTVPPVLRPAATLLVRGRVLDARTRQPIATADVRYELLPAGTEAGVVLPAPAGAFEATLPAGQLYGLRATAPGYLSVNENLDLTTVARYGVISRDLLLLPLAAPVADATKAEEKVALNNLFFVQGKPVLLPGSFPELDRLAEALAAHPTLQIRLDGHTDNVGDANDPRPNQVLSEQRVAAVRAYLVKHGIAESRLSTRGYGGSRPVAPNDTEAHKARNRRVEFVIVKS